MIPHSESPASLLRGRYRWLALLALSLLASSAKAEPESGPREDASALPAVLPAGSGDAVHPEASHGDEPSGYGEAVEAGIKEHERKNYEEARAHFQRAHELFPNARTARGLGKVDYELRNYGDAVRYLEEALSSNVRPLDAALRAETEKLLERARVYVGEVRVDVEPGSATVIVDGVTMATGPKASLSLLVGDHVLEFRAQGRLSERRSVRINGGEQTIIQVVLAAPPDMSTPARPIDEAKPLRKQWWVWAGVGVVVAAVAAGIAVAATKHDSEPSPADPGSTNVLLRNP
jgi:tetratricopeptide (TPR) repeat protein